ncbi:MAG: S49 family peptidase [Sphingopyxis terrae]|nr:S49 family peptidase [Sphingopyxis terrae]
MRQIGAGPQPYTNVARQLLDRPLAILPHQLEATLLALQARLGLVEISTIDATAMEAKAMLERSALSGDARREWDSGRSFHTDGEVAVIPIVGTLVPRFGWLDPMCGMTGYDGLTRKLRDAVRDPAIEAIWFDIDSPGGAVAGLEQFVLELAEFADTGGKPIYAWVNEQACSAAYAIASTCHKVYGPETAMVGSIGCCMAHTDITGALDEAGVKVTIIRYGERKMRGSSVEKLDKVTLAKFQASCDAVRDRFAKIVAMGRGITVDDAMATEADWFEGSEAVDLGLMDAVTTEREAWARLEEEIDRNKRERRSAR